MWWKYSIWMILLLGSVIFGGRNTQLILIWFLHIGVMKQFIAHMFGVQLPPSGAPIHLCCVHMCSCIMLWLYYIHSQWEDAISYVLFVHSDFIRITQASILYFKWRTLQSNVKQLFSSRLVWTQHYRTASLISCFFFFSILLHS